MALVEVAGHAGTSHEALAKTLALTKVIKKTPVVLRKECPGFIVNRVIVQYFVKCLESFLLEGVRPDVLDKTFRKMGMVMGPFKTLDLVGWDIGVHVLKSMAKSYCLNIESLQPFIETVERKEMLGQKSGQGFYLWQGDKSTGTNEELCRRFLKDEFITETYRPKAPCADCVSKKIYAHMRREAEAIVEAGICDADSVDLALILGMGCTPNKRGLLKK